MGGPMGPWAQGPGPGPRAKARPWARGLGPRALAQARALGPGPMGPLGPRLFYIIILFYVFSTVRFYFALCSFILHRAVLFRMDPMVPYGRCLSAPLKSGSRWYNPDLGCGIHQV